MITLISILKILYSVFSIPNSVMAVIVIALIAVFICIAVRLLFHIDRYPWKRRIGAGILVIYLVCTVCKLIPYIEFVLPAVKPELVATLETDGFSNNSIYTYYSIKRGLSQTDSIYQRKQSYATTNEQDWIVSNTQDTDHYTYIISYGCEISEITYTMWESTDSLPVPWNDAIMYPDFSIAAENNSTIYIYRIDKVLIEAGL